MSTAPEGFSVYEEVRATPDFVRLRHKFRSFVFPLTVAFLAWYLLYVVMSAFARDFMAVQLVGNINVALVFGLLQFVSTFAIAYFYARHAGSTFDPLAERIREEAQR
ncbi:uncharacterized membrane protein (DUF485 family) [Actinocorallia herbida]|uniref:Uncharacterized membrane protein (DUF485 family) n=1 Tax=Actinocorallia herbida TaxID=58109 RepID=A0A3N1D5Z2_9ACTN|nr:DUF485 domain-containing protein [Actinocorallia herbida]ROO88876.1 uncharacterized membrane protein (DUF485 family) [Actinocorallia herbida]